MSRVFLGIDCATRFLSLALWDERRGPLASFQEEVGRDHAARIVPELERLFARASVALGQVAAVGVGVGPGSYTGVRVGLATARGLGRAWSVPVAGASTLAAMAAGALGPGESGAAALDARRGNVYAAAYRHPEGAADLRLEELLAATKLPRDALSARLAELAAGLRIVEDVPPLAAYTAASARERRPAEAVYL